MATAPEYDIIEPILCLLNEEHKECILENIIKDIHDRSDKLHQSHGQVRLALHMLGPNNRDEATERPLSNAGLRCRIAVIEYLCAQLNICYDADDQTKISHVVSLCLQNQSVFEKLVYQCLLSVVNHVAYLGETPEGFVVANKVLLGEYVSIPSRNLETVDCKVQCLPALNFLKLILWSNHTAHFTLLEDFILPLCALLGAQSRQVRESAFNALVPLLGNHKILSDSRHKRDSRSSNVVYPTIEVIWTMIVNLVSCKQSPVYATSGYYLWSRILSCHSPAFPPGELFQQPDYWVRIQTGIAKGTIEQQKACLSILQQSLVAITKTINDDFFKFNVDEQDHYSGYYSRFVTVAETLVVSRYLNQVKDCTENLSIISSASSPIHKSWIISLLAATLRHGVQDSTRKILGNWTLLYGCPILVLTPENAGDFIEHILLPWATIGHHFTTTIYQTQDGHPACGHGDRLVHFLKSLLLSANQNCPQHLHIYVNAILNFLKINVGRLYAFTRVFVLEGLAKGLESTDCSLDKEPLLVILECFSTGGLHVIARDVMTLYCARLSARAVNNHGYFEERIAHLKRLEKEALDINPNVGNSLYMVRVGEGSLRIDHPPTAINSFEWIKIDDAQHLTVDAFASWLRQTRHRCLDGDGLGRAVSLLPHLLANLSDTDNNSDSLTYALQAVWEEIEVQDYPRRPLMASPQIFLHLNVLRMTTGKRELTDFILETATNLQNLAETRVHVWSPLASTLRQAFLVVPEQSEFLFVQFYGGIATNPPVTKEDFYFEAVMATKLNVPGKSYQTYYGPYEGHGYACAFDALNKLDLSRTSLPICIELLDVLLAPWLKQKAPVPVYSAWKTTTSLQLVLVLIEKLVPVKSSEYSKKLLDTLYKLLSIEPLPRYRYLMEWMIVRIYVREMNLRQNALHILRYQDDSNPKHSVSLIKICLMIASLPDSGERYAYSYMTQLIPLSGSQKIIIRHEAQWTFPWLWDEAVRRDWTSLTGNTAFSALNDYIRSLESYKNPHPWRMQERFDPIRDHNLTHLFQGEYLTLEPSEPERTSRKDLLHVSRDDDHQLAKLSPAIPLGETRFQRSCSAPKSTDVILELQSLAVSNVPIQTKSAAAWKSTDITPTIGMNSTDLGKRKTRDVIVVCSLINNAYNLGGLSRVAEIFGARSLKVQDLRVLGNKDFTSVSVSSHMWLPIEELPAVDVSEFLIQSKLDGYTVIGIEQTDRSKILGEAAWQMPAKIVLVLGSEREGIPARLLAEMDHCVEIPQIGITRSMNVQTAAAVVLYEHSRQQHS